MNTIDTHKALDCLSDSLKSNAQKSLGYPVAKDFDYSFLYPFLQLPLNNIGDPFTPSTYKVDTREVEREVLNFMAQLFRAPKDHWWGYVTNGGSEGNLYGLYLAREYFPKGMVYYSQATHYSVTKNLHLLDMPRVVIKAQENGEIDYEDLRQTLQINRHITPIIFINIGTTMKEAKDDLKKIRQMLDELAIEDYHIHADGALSGMIAPFLTPRPAFDFADGVDSIAVSGHKFIGSPIPCGFVLVKKHLRDKIARSISYIGSEDTTISGSRNGFTPLVLWYAIKQLGKEGLAQRAQQSLQLAEYTENRLKEMGIPAWRNPNAITVVFPDPGPEITHKWQLAVEKGITHVILMPGTDTHQINAFLEDMATTVIPKGEFAMID
ncbi:histidine decarboxylase [Rapidithrix thailandica]|uniref:Histidine decarboxylase n=1 Tax=Rapidithrix thailandica TaxID=413964 RepID=A0AAW9SFA4_9BACT